MMLTHRDIFTDLLVSNRDVNTMEMYCNSMKSSFRQVLLCARFEVFTAVKIQGSDVVGYHCFAGPYCLYLQGSKVLQNTDILPQHYTT